MGIFRVGDILGGHFLWWGFFGWELSGENHPDGNFPGGSFPSTAVFMVRGISLGNGFWVVNTLRAPVRKRIKRSTLNFFNRVLHKTVAAFYPILTCSIFIAIIRRVLKA